MAKVVFTVKVGSHYDDDIETRYHFPRTYLKHAQAAVGDVAVYYEPRRGNGRQAYFATVEVREIVPDPQKADHYYANVTNMLGFDWPVPFKIEQGFLESALEGADGRTNLGSFQRAVRILPENEFAAILALGMSPTMQALDTAPTTIPGLQEPPDTFQRPIVQQILNRKFRDAAFSRQIREAYDATCAVTGLRLINGGGRPEIEAAHIKPVAVNGPDIISNGIALCRTAHWMFDRGLLSLGDNGAFLVARHVTEDMRRLLRQDGKMILPKSTEAHPHPKFIKWHRESKFKGV